MIDFSLLTFPALLGFMVLTLGAGVGWMMAQVRADRLPAATRYADILERLAIRQTELDAVSDKIAELNRQVHDRDRVIAELQAALRQLEDTKLELQNLTPAREEIARVKQEAADAALERDQVAQDRAELKKQVDSLREELDPARIERLTELKQLSERELARVQGDLARIRPELDEAMKRIAEASSAEVRLESLLQRAKTIEEEISQLNSKLAPIAEAYDTENRKLESARQARIASEDARDEADRRRARIDSEIAALTAIRDKLAGEVIGLNSEGSGTAEASDEQRLAMLADLVEAPTCLASPTTLRQANRSETEALHQVDRYLKDSGLRFDRETVRAFHTALKINDACQLTVLAGVSGTGKSLLPRRYAEAMGMHFQQIAVEPRWDSPQDLLGFYNYVEKKYRATELSRLLAHFDPWKSLDLGESAPDRRDHMAIVLLDEMNLARVEYYFSEFLSRLEARPTWKANLALEKCKDAMIPVDIRGLSNPPRLFPAHNLLFVGTMNDDESTQSLSDKVLDRGNVLQFPAPTEFPQPAQASGAAAAEAQSFREWRSWVKPASSLDGSSANLVKDTIEKLAEVMQSFGRPFGHRLSHAIQAYAANYPHEGNGSPRVETPLADQIEFRILPKLRGVEIDTHSNDFDTLERFVRERLSSGRLADRIAETRNDQGAKSGLFVWRGLPRNV